MTHPQLLIASAAAFEVEPLLLALKNHAIPFQYVEVGVGALKAATNATKIQTACRDRDVLFVGTAGCFYADLTTTIVRAERVCWMPYGLRVNKSYKIQGDTADLSIERHHPAFSSIRGCKVVCSGEIAMDAALPADWRPEEWVENVELYSFAQQALAVSRSLTALLYLTNSVGPEAHKQWKANFKQAAHVTAQAVISRLKAQGKLI